MADAHAARRRILHVFPGFDVGGVQLRIASVLNRYPDRYANVIVAMNDRFDCFERLDDGVDATRRPLGLAKGHPLGTLCRIRRELADIAPDLLVTYNWGAIEWALVNRVGRRVPHIHMESGFGPDEADRQLPRRVMTRRLALAGTQRIVVPSHNLMRIARDIWKLPEARLLCVPNGVDLKRFAAAPDRTILPDWPAVPVIGTVAPMRPEKNLARLLRAFASISAVRDVRLLMVGDGPERAGLEALADELGIGAKVHFTGYLDAPERAFGLMDIFAISSDTEQMPNALIQAMAASRCVAGMDVGDVAHIVSAENRPYIAPAGDDDAFRDRLLGLVDDAGARGVLGAANWCRVGEEYDQERMVEIYRTLFDGDRPAARAADRAA